MNSMILRNLSYGMYAIGVKGKRKTFGLYCKYSGANYIAASANHCCQYESL